MHALTFTKVLCPVDFSDFSGKVLSRAVRLAEDFGATCYLLHVVQLPAVPDSDFGMLDRLFRESRADAERHAESLRREVASDRVVPIVVSEGDPAQRIVEMAAREEFDLIVMGTHGRSGLRHLLIGSVAEKVVRSAPCPVLTLRT